MRLRESNFLITEGMKVHIEFMRTGPVNTRFNYNLGTVLTLANPPQDFRLMIEETLVNYGHYAQPQIRIKCVPCGRIRFGELTRLLNDLIALPMIEVEEPEPDFYSGSLAEAWAGENLFGIPIIVPPPGIQEEMLRRDMQVLFVDTESVTVSRGTASSITPESMRAAIGSFWESEARAIESYIDRRQTESRQTREPNECPPEAITQERINRVFGLNEHSDRSQSLAQNARALARHLRTVGRPSEEIERFIDDRAGESVSELIVRQSSQLAGETLLGNIRSGLRGIAARFLDERDVEVTEIRQTREPRIVQHGKSIVYGRPSNWREIAENLRPLFKVKFPQKMVKAIATDEHGKPHLIESTATHWRLVPQVAGFRNRWDFANAIEITKR